MLKSLASAVLALVASSAAMAQPSDQSGRHVQIASTNTGSVWFLDRATVKTDGQMTSVWLDMDHSRDKSEPARHSRALLSIDCAAHRFSWVQFFRFRPDGAPMREPVPPNVSMDIPPGSPIETVGQEICGGMR